MTRTGKAETLPFVLSFTPKPLALTALSRLRRPGERLAGTLARCRRTPGTLLLSRGGRWFVAIEKATGRPARVTVNVRLASLCAKADRP